MVEEHSAAQRVDKEMTKWPRGNGTGTSPPFHGSASPITAITGPRPTTAYDSNFFVEAVYLKRLFKTPFSKTDWVER